MVLWLILGGGSGKNFRALVNKIRENMTKKAIKGAKRVFKIQDKTYTKIAI